jgi:hypothetical protein
MGTGGRWHQFAGRSAVAKLPFSADYLYLPVSTLSACCNHGFMKIHTTLDMIRWEAMVWTLVKTFFLL